MPVTRGVLFDLDGLPIAEVELVAVAPMLVRYAGRLFVFIRRETMSGRLTYAEADVYEVDQ